jgi:hypothetical protein
MLSLKSGDSAMKTLICLIALAGSFLPRCAFGDDEVFVPANDVSFTISTDRKSYPAADNIIVRYEIKNISNRALFVPRGQWSVTCPASPHLWIWFEDSFGKHFIGGWAGSCSGEPKTMSERMQREAVLLRPTECIEGKLMLDPKVFQLKPGEYRIEASLDGWKDVDFNQQQRRELTTLGYPFLRGEVPTSIRIALD